MSLFGYVTADRWAGGDKSAIHNFVLFLIEVGVGMELYRSIVLPLDRLQFFAFLLKEEFYHFRMRSDADAR